METEHKNNWQEGDNSLENVPVQRFCYSIGLQLYLRKLLPTRNWKRQAEIPIVYCQQKPFCGHNL